MKFSTLLLLCQLAWPVQTIAQANEPEQTVDRVVETKRGRKVITETRRGDVLVRKRVEEHRTGDKPVEVKYTRHYLEGKEVLFECWDSRSKITTRYFKVENQLVMGELGRDGDGFFEWMVFFGKKGEVTTVFRRTADGRLKLLEGADLEEFRKGADLGRMLFSD